jgi:hypothetical protein
MKTIKFEDALKDYLEEMKRTGWYTKAYKAFVEANILKLVMERRPVADPNATMMDLFDATEMTEIVRESEAMTEAFMKSEIERIERVLSPPEGNLLRLPSRSNDLAAPQIPDDTGATPAMGRERPAAEPARTWRSTTSCVGNGSTPSAYKAGGRGRTDRGDNRTPAAGAGE